MAKLAVFDRHYLTKNNTYPSLDIVGPALRSSEHDVIATAKNIGEAVGHILAFKDGDPRDRPDIVIIGGRLNGENEYKKAPMTIDEPCKVRHRGWGGAREVDGIRRTFLLPQYRAGSEKYIFPTVEDVDPRLPHETARQWGDISANLAGPLLSRLVHTYLPPETVRLGVSTDYMLDSVVHQTILRGQVDAVRTMYDFVEHYGHYADINRGQ